MKDETIGIVPGLVWAFRFSGDGTAQPLDPDGPIEAQRERLWLHLNLADARALEWLEHASLPVPAKSVLRTRTAHQQLHAIDGCICGVVSDLARKFEGTDDSVVHLYFAMTEHMLISGRHHAVTSAAKAREAIEKGQVRIAGVAGLFELIVDKLADGVDHFIDDLGGRLDTIEDGQTRGGRPAERIELGRVRRTCVKMHRELSGLRMVLLRLERERADMLPTIRIGAEKLTQRLDALDREVIDLRDRARLLQEEIDAAAAEESNRALAILSVITAVFLPPTLVTGFFGMNTKGLPFGDDPDGTMYASGLMVVSVVVVLIILWRIGVLRRAA